MFTIEVINEIKLSTFLDDSGRYIFEMTNEKLELKKKIETVTNAN